MGFEEPSASDGAAADNAPVAASTRKTDMALPAPVAASPRSATKRSSPHKTNADGWWPLAIGLPSAVSAPVSGWIEYARTWSAPRHVTYANLPVASTTMRCGPAPADAGEPGVNQPLVGSIVYTDTLFDTAFGTYRNFELGCGTSSSGPFSRPAATM